MSLSSHPTASNADVFSDVSEVGEMFLALDNCPLVNKDRRE